MPEPLINQLAQTWTEGGAYDFVPRIDPNKSNRELLEQMVQDPGLRGEIADLARTHGDPNVCAHALRAISLRPNAETEAVLREFFTDDREFRVMLGSFLIRKTLGEVAKHLYQRYQHR